MAAFTSWATLHAQREGIPQLLIKFRLDATGYEVLLTDLSRVWGEKLSKQYIIKQAIDSNCAIDPSQDTQQYQILVDKIRTILNQQEGTSVDLQATSNGPNALALTLSTPLPAPLPVFQWTIILSEMQAECVGAELVTPLLQHAQALEQQIQGLIREIQSKDRMIAKITDRLEDSGNDLTTVFPGVSHVKRAKDKSQRDQLARHVLGLGDFDADAWKAQLHAAGNGHVPTEDAIDSIFREVRAASSNQQVSTTATEWWRGLRQESRHPALESRSELGHQRALISKVVHSEQAQNDIVLDDAFQRQATPHRRIGESKLADHGFDASRGDNGADGQHASREETVDSETEDEDDLDAPPTRSKGRAHSQKPTQHSQPAPIEPIVSAARKLGTVGGRSKEVTPPTVGAKVASPADFPAKLGSFGGQRMLSAPVKQDKESVEEAPPAKIRSKLGTLGGKAKAIPAPEPAQPYSPVKAASPALAQMPNVVPIGGRRDVSSPGHTPEEDQERSSRSLQTKASPSPRETSEERANKKREQLKRELQEKSGQTVKKKRKF